MPPHQAAASLSAIEGVNTVTPSDGAGPAGCFTYRLELAQDSDHWTVCARLASHVQSAGADLFELQMERHDLETLFREVSKAPLSALDADSEDEDAIDDAA
jgi:hypothetical protein